jgi:hypothetical protein
MKSFIPHFIIIGTTHSGVSTIVSLLEQHPGIADKIPNTQFFSVGYKKQSVLWYQSQFAGLTGIIGECSPGYLVSERAPALIAETLQSGSLVAWIRNPIERLIAEYEALVPRKNGRPTMSCYQYAKNHPLALERGRYGYHLERYFAYYSPLQLQVFVWEDFVRDPILVLRTLYTFLEANSEYVPPALQAYLPPPDPPKHKPGPLKRLIRWLVGTLKQKKVERQKLLFPAPCVIRSYLSPAELAALKKYYLPDAERLSGLLRRDMVSEWFPDQI